MDLTTLASTKTTFCLPTSKSIEQEDKIHEDFLSGIDLNEYTYPQLHQNTYNSSNGNSNPNIITHLQWLDSSSILTKSTDNAFRVYIPPSDLLDSRTEQQLIPFIRCFHNTSIQSFETHPLSSVYRGSIPTLVSSNDMPLKLVDLIPGGGNGKYRLLKTFNNMNQYNEKYESFLALKFVDGGERFIAGGGGKMLKLFDVNRTGPIRDIENIKGLISTITVSFSEFGYAGFYTGGFNGHLSIHDSQGTIVESTKMNPMDGNGISQILESKNGKYLYVVSRNSGHIRVLDLRMGLQQLSTYDLKLESVDLGSQRVFGDVLDRSQGLMIGGTNGLIHWFKDAELGQSTNHVTYDLLDASGATINNLKVNPDDNNILALGIGDREHTNFGLNISNCTEY
ncbi:hypothetical protein WICPIJ_004684 [Wickerhamomyces pijperi]|uniref:Protein SWT21 n=1 Tax=Wickerhamomyces pijperi TaxID=599730 RepID=A0A9P8Q586_WICPI|nr:hypothetical protein WICPIJ_004684 [Wickerhamomyces pijperi]